MERLDLYGHIDENGLFLLHNRQRFLEWARQYPCKDISIRFERKSAKRSDPQNRFYWGCVIKEIAIRLRDLGHHRLTDEDVHDIMKLKFNHEEYVSEDGEILEIPKSTADLTTVQFSEYVDTVRMWAADFLGINIPDPNTQTQMTFNE